MKTLHLVLKSKWYDKIASGEKTSEYRECKPYWNKRLAMPRGDLHSGRMIRYNRVVFHRGYTNITMLFPINDITITHEPNDLGLDRCWEIKLGNRIQ